MSTVRAEFADQTEIEELVPALRIFARLHRADSDDADQLVQQTLEDAGDKIALLEPDLRPSTWLLSIMHALSRNQSEDDADSRPQPGMAVAAKSWSSSARAIWSALERLPLHHREVLILTDVLGERYEDAAHICNCAVGTIKSRLNRARHHMRQELQAKDGGALAG